VQNIKKKLDKFHQSKGLTLETYNLSTIKERNKKIKKLPF